MRIRRDVRGGDAPLPQYLRPHRFIRPIDIRLWIAFLCDQAVHSARALGLLGVIDRTDFDASVSLEILDDRFRKDLVVAHIHDDGVSLLSGQKTPQDKRKNSRGGYREGKPLCHGVSFHNAGRPGSHCPP